MSFCWYSVFPWGKIRKWVRKVCLRERRRSCWSGWKEIEDVSLPSVIYYFEWESLVSGDQSMCFDPYREFHLLQASFMNQSGPISWFQEVRDVRTVKWKPFPLPSPTFPKPCTSPLTPSLFSHGKRQQCHHTISSLSVNNRFKDSWCRTQARKRWPRGCTHNLSSVPATSSPSLFLPYPSRSRMSSFQTWMLRIFSPWGREIP